MLVSAVNFNDSEFSLIDSMHLLTLTHLLSCTVNKLAESEVEEVLLVPALADQLPVVGLVVAGLPGPHV